jgi:Mg2+/Co2+ transporter CorC
MQFTITEGQAKTMAQIAIDLTQLFVDGINESIEFEGTVKYDDNYRNDYKITAVMTWDNFEQEFYWEYADKTYDIVGLALLMSRIDDLDWSVE